jgi:Macrocin-O-methyltransferase (TylF)
MVEAKELYLDLMKRALLGLLFDEAKSFRPINTTITRRFHKRAALTLISQYLARTNKQIMQPVSFDLEKRLNGSDWPPPAFAHTMIGMKRLNNLQACIEEVLQKGVHGDFIETGAWRGGATIFMRAVLQAYGVEDRLVWVADSFAGLPEGDGTKYPADAGDVHHTYNVFLSVSLEEVQDNFRRYNLLDDQVRFLKGWFKETLPAAPIKSLAVLRLDGDMYESTLDGFTHLYPKVSSGGYVIIDDYHLAGCRQAVHDYRAAHGIDEEIKDIDGMGVYWQKI